MSPSPPPPPPSPTLNLATPPESEQESLPASHSATLEQSVPSAGPTMAADDEGQAKETEGNGEDQIKEAEAEEEEEEGECGFCLFMKGGGCKDAFIAWEKCVEDTEKSGGDIVDKCSEVTALLKKCMDAHADYYEPILRAEQAMIDAASDDPGSGEQIEGKDS